jgi:hypothetical protein
VMESLISSPDNFCPADMHVPSVRTLRRSRCGPDMCLLAVDGQFDDVSLGE